MREKTTLSVGNIIKSYLSQFPELSSTDIAKRILSNPVAQNHFKSEENARALIRYYRGKMGSKAKAELRTMQYIQQELNVPKGRKNELKHYKLPTSINKILLISDVHAPYHDEVALTAALDRKSVV